MKRLEPCEALQTIMGMQNRTKLENDEAGFMIFTFNVDLVLLDREAIQSQCLPPTDDIHVEH